MVSEKRRMFLYMYDSRGASKLITTKSYVYTTKAHERQLADEFAAKYGYRQGDGHIAIVDENGIGIDKLEFQP